MIGGPGDRIGWCPNCYTVQWRRAARALTPSWCDNEIAGCVNCESAWGVDILASVCGWCATQSERHSATEQRTLGLFTCHTVCSHVPTQPWDRTIDSGELVGAALIAEIEEALALAAPRLSTS